MAMGLFAKKTQKNKTPGIASASKISPVLEKTKEVDVARPTQIPLSVYSMLRAPRITEKGSILSAQGGSVYAFEVSGRAAKGSVKYAVEALYKVNVAKVRMVHVPPKKRRLGKFQGFRKGFKKAYVTLQDGQKMDLGTSV